MEAGSVHQALDLRHHLTASSRARKPSPLKSLIKYYSIPDVITLAGGLPHPMYFPFQSISFRVPRLESVAHGKSESAIEPFCKSAHELMDDLKSFETMKMETGAGVTEVEGSVDLAKILQYGSCQGFTELLPVLRQMNDIFHPPAYADRDVVITCGNTDGLAKVARMILERGDVCLMEEFTYPAARETLDPMGIISYGLHMDNQGIIPEHLEHVLTNWEDQYIAKEGAKRPHVLYMVSTGQNPTGATYGIERRKQIYQSAQKWDMIIIEDDPYLALNMEPYIPNITKSPLVKETNGLRSSAAKAPRKAEQATLEPPPETLWHNMYDAHSHPTDDPERDNWTEMDKVKVAKVCVMSSGVENQKFVSDMAINHPEKVVPCFGFHPWFSHSICFDYDTLGKDKLAHYCQVFGDDPDDDLEDLLDLLPAPVDSRTVLAEMRANLERHKTAMVGEIGLDRSYRVPNNRQRRLTKLQLTMDAQWDLVESQVGLAVEFGRPISFHAVQAQGPLLDFLQQMKLKYGARWHTIRVCLHSFSGSVETLKQIVKEHRNAYFSFSTTINGRYKRLPNLIEAAPVDRILVESDWNSTQGMAEKLWQITQVVAKAKEWTHEQVLHQTAHNWNEFVYGKVSENGTKIHKSQVKEANTLEKAPACNETQAYISALTPSMCSLDVDGRVIRLDTVSKILAPGMRFGWITASAMFVERLTRDTEVSTQTPSGLSGAVMLQLLGSNQGQDTLRKDHRWGLDGYVRWLMSIRLEYTTRRNLFLDALSASCPEGLLSWITPTAGMFVWVKIHLEKHPNYRGRSDIKPLMDQVFKACLDEKVIVCPSEMFLAEDDTERTGIEANFVRMTFARASWEQLEKGPARFCKAIASFFQRES